MPRPSFAAAALLAAPALACAPAPLDPPRPIAVAPTPAPVPPATAEPLAAPALDAGLDAAPPIAAKPAGPPALPPEDPSIGRFRLRARTSIDGASHDCGLPMFHQIAPLPGGAAWITGSCDIRLFFDGQKFTAHKPVNEQRPIVEEGKRKTCRANAGFWALAAQSDHDAFVAGTYTCGYTCAPIGLRDPERFDGKRWNKLPLGLPASADNDTMPTALAVTRSGAIWGLRPGDAPEERADGKARFVGGELYAFGKSGWGAPRLASPRLEQMDQAPTGVRLSSYRAIAARGEEIWLAGALVGWDGTAHRLASATWRYDGAAWDEQLIADPDVFAISASNDGELWAASHKALFHWDGKAWIKVEIGLDPRISIEQIAAGGKKDVWIVAQPPADPTIKYAPLPEPLVLSWDGARLGRAGIDGPEPGARVRIQEIKSNGAEVWVWELEAAYQLVSRGAASSASPAVYLHPNPPAKK